MKLRVRREDGNIETLTLVPPVRVVLGLKLNHLTDDSGVDYYFCEDGSYDGWGMALEPNGPDADEVISRIEAAREIEIP